MLTRYPWLKTFLCMAYFYLVMTSYYILKPVRESFFLGELGFKKLPHVHVLVMFVVLVASAAYAALIRRMTRRGLVVATNLVFIVVILAFWVLIGPMDASAAMRKKLAWIYYCWVSCYSVFAVTLFWSFTHSIHSSEEGARVYGWIGAGGTLGAMSGGWLTERLASSVGSVDLMLASAAALVPCLAIGWTLAPDTHEEAKAEKPKFESSTLDLIRKSPYLLGIVALVFCGVFASGLDDFRFKDMISSSFSDFDLRTAFLGKVYKYTNILGLFIGTCLTGPLQSRYGPLPGLLVAPAAIAIGGVVLYSTSSMEAVFWVMVASNATAYSIFQTSRELLFVPTSREEKFLAKGFITTFVYRAGVGFASLLILVAWPDGARRATSMFTVPAGLGIMGIGWWLSRRYQELVAKRSKDTAASA